MNNVANDKVPSEELPRENDIQKLVRSLEDELDCDKVTTCQHARRKLVLIGPPAIPALVKALSSPRIWVRWEAAKALSEIADPESTDILIKMLQSTEFELHWLAAEGLARIGPSVIKPLLQALVKNSDSMWLKLGVHRVLHDTVISQDVFSIIRPVREALEDPETEFKAPLAARAAIRELNRLEQKKLA